MLLTQQNYEVWKNEHEKLSCHAHNDTNLWRPWDSKGRELFEVLRTRVIEEETHDAEG